MVQLVKNPPAMQETWVRSWVGKIPWRRAWQPTPVLLPGQSPWTEMPGWPQSFGLQKVGHNWAANHIAHTLSYINLLTFLNVGLWFPASRMRGVTSVTRTLLCPRHMISKKLNHNFILFLTALCGRHAELMQPGIKPVLLAVEAQSLNHGTTRETSKPQF